MSGETRWRAPRTKRPRRPRRASPGGGRRTLGGEGGALGGRRGHGGCGKVIINILPSSPPPRLETEPRVPEIARNIRGRDPGLCSRHRRSRRAPRRYAMGGDTDAARVHVAAIADSDQRSTLVVGGFPGFRHARRTSTAPRLLESASRSAVAAYMHLYFAPQAWSAAPLLLTHSAQLTQPTVRLPQL